jgi:hypothetical protein
MLKYLVVQGCQSETVLQDLCLEVCMTCNFQML